MLERIRYCFSSCLRSDFPISIWFLPYLVCYLLFWILRLPIQNLLLLFQTFHLILGFGVLSFGANKFSRFDLRDKIFLIGLFLFLFLPGAYLEFPSDAWEHFRRIFRWQDLGFISDYPHNSKYKFAYFWNYSLVSWLPMSTRRLGFDFLSTFWQALMCIQIYKLSRQLKCEKSEAQLQVLGFLVLFGSNVSSIRYYALSSTMLAYVAYLDIVLLVHSFCEHKKLSGLSLIPLMLCLIILNHLQELLFVGISSAAILLYFFFHSLSQPSQRKFRYISISLIGLALLIGYYLVHFRTDLYSRMDPVQISRFGSFRLWSLSHKYYLEALGVHGIVAIVLSAFLLRSFPLLAVLSLAPVCTLLFPLSVLFYSFAAPNGYITYRILYAFPLSIAFVKGIWLLSGRLQLKERMQMIFCTLVILAFALPMSFPWRGRLAFALYQPTAGQSLVWIDQTAQWFADHRDLTLFRHCRLISDNETLVGLAAQLGREESMYGGESARRGKSNTSLEDILETAKTAEDIQLFARRMPPFCGVLVADVNKIPPAQVSLIAETSKHWKSEQGDLRWYQSADFSRAARDLPAVGWTKTEVPPFYTLYEPPILVEGNAQ